MRYLHNAVYSEKYLCKQIPGGKTVITRVFFKNNRGKVEHRETLQRFDFLIFFVTLQTT